MAVATLPIMTGFQQNVGIGRALQALNTGDVQGATKICHQILSTNKRDATALAVLGQIASSGSRFEEAVQYLTKAIQIAPKEIDYHVLLAEAYSTQAKHREALSRYEKALKLRKDYGPALSGKANVLLRQEKVDRAKAILQPIVKAGREDATIAMVYARILRREGEHAEAAALARRHIDDRGISDEFKRKLWFEAGQAHERAGDLDDAFAAYTAGNEVHKRAWDPDAERRRYEETVDVFTPELLERLPRPTHDTSRPIFIIGMPRSGSTLVEQILDAHPDVHGAGELLVLPGLVDQASLIIGSTAPFPACAADMDQNDVNTLSMRYLDALRQINDTAPRVSDKYLGSYEYLGLISVLFPQARVIHTRRNPLDTCLSCFVQRFSLAVPAYTENLRHLGLLYQDYMCMMDAWSERGLEFLDVQYEEMVADQEGQSRRLIEFCGLEWDDACLRFFETKREVLTLSRDQVNKPIYKTSAGKWRRFEKHLGPLLEVVGNPDDDGHLPADAE